MTKNKCRRCSECVGQAHHWMDNDAFQDEGDPQYACKHCPAVAFWCEECVGEGCKDCNDTGIGEIREPAPANAMSQHTPGPWQCDLSQRDAGEWIEIYNNNNPMAIIAEVSVTMGYADADKANAVLIVAAPETFADRNRLRAALMALSATDDDTTAEAGEAVHAQVNDALKASFALYPQEEPTHEDVL